MNILLLHSQAEIRELLCFPLEEKLSSKVQSVFSPEETKAVLDEKKFSPHVIVAENTEEALSLLKTIAKEFSLKGELALCGEAKDKSKPAVPNLKFLGYAANDKLLDNLVALLQPRADKFSKEEAAIGLDGDFCRINTALLLRFNPLAADVYIRLSPMKYIKLFNKNDEFSMEDLKKYRDVKKIDYLYLKNADSNVFVAKLLKELDKMMQANPPASPLAAAETLESTVETIHSLLSQVGATEEVQKAVKGAVGAALKSMGDFPELGNILANLKDHQGKYIGHHSMLLSSISCALAVEMDWYSEATFEKLTMAAMMHDASLQDHDLCAVKSLLEFDKKYKGKFNTQQIQLYRGHPEKSALMLGHFKELPAEVDKIILQHHEHPMGSGFPHQLTGNYITPLSSLFIVAHDISDFVIDNKGDLDIDAFMDEFKNKYASGNFRKIAKAVENLDLG